jgi:chromosome segregation ATPase
MSLITIEKLFQTADTKNLERRIEIMAGKLDSLREGVNRLIQTSAEEKEEVAAALGELRTAVDAFTEQVEAGKLYDAEIQALTADVNSAVEGVESIFTKETPPEEPEEPTEPTEPPTEPPTEGGEGTPESGTPRP